MARKVRTLVTGASGFIGSHLVEELIKRGHQVWALVRDPKYLDKMDYADLYKFYGDILTINELTYFFKKLQFDYIFHLAGLTKSLDEDSFFRINVEATKNLMNIALDTQNNLKRFLFFSSLSASGPGKGNELIKISHEPNPISTYGKSKLNAEQLVIESTLPYTIIRPPVVYGPRDKDVFIYFKLAKKYNLVPIITGNRILSMIYVKDLVNGSINAVLSDNTISGTYFLTDGSCHTWDEIINTIKEIMGIKPIRLPIPSYGVHFAGELGELLGKLQKKTNTLNREKAVEMLAFNWACSDEEAEKDFDYKSSWDLKKGFTETIDWYIKEAWL
ncbi:MAG: NAD(P)-dependent oxidoreductase [Candidatus Coatesbacteria bacterium]|nr:NAD(P)-dependent oxidoreductase [Candidatus Coatesbacteria bacterium]